MIEVSLELGCWRLVFLLHQIFTRLSAGRTIGQLSGTLKALAKEAAPRSFCVDAKPAGSRETPPADAAAGNPTKLSD
jgi:hypothetical protein